MNDPAIFAFVIVPIIVVAIGYVAVLLHEAATRRLDAQAQARSSQGAVTGPAPD